MAQANARSITPSLPRALPKAAAQKVGAAIEAHLDAIEALTAFLDEADGDPDEEPDGIEDEPSLGSLGSSSSMLLTQEAWASGPRDDTEEEHDGAEPSEDPEPELGWGADLDQERARKNVTGTVWLPGGRNWVSLSDGVEAEHDGREPSLGSLNPDLCSPGSFAPRERRLDQTLWAAGDRRDLEGDEHDGREPEEVL
jgi:hypothetical protein